LHGNLKSFKTIDIDSNKHINWTTFSSQKLVCYKQSISNFEKYQTHFYLTKKRLFEFETLKMADFELSQDLIDRYNEDGAVLIKGAFSQGFFYSSFLFVSVNVNVF
jgi:hypothetical protein